MTSVLTRAGAILLGAAITTALATTPGSAQQACYRVVSYIAPNPMRCQEVGRDNLGRPIWLCC